MESSYKYDMGAVINGEGIVTNLDFHADGRWLVMSTNQGSIQLIDALAGEEKKKVNCKSTGVRKLKYTHHESCVLITSDKKVCDAKYLSLYDNRFLRSFTGHGDFINSIAVNPLDDIFLTASNDKTVRRWDLSSPKEISRITLPSYCSDPIVAFDSSGIVFGVMSQNLKDYTYSLRLFDARNCESGPFQDIAPPNQLQMKALVNEYPHLVEETMARPPKCAWTSFEFSRDGNNILINTDSEIVWMVDSFRPDVQPRIFGPRKNDSNQRDLGACMSTDCQYVLTGNEDNELLVFNKSTGEQAACLAGHVSPIGCIAFNPKYDMFASSCGNTVLWIPNEAQA